VHKMGLQDGCQHEKLTHTCQHSCF
jgi:hypothetical protein